MSDDIDRTDELLELYAEDQRAQAIRNNGEDPDDPGPPEPPEEPADTAQPPPDDGNDIEGAIAHRLHVLRINAEARRRLEEELHPQAVPPPIRNLDTLLAQPDSPTRYLIEEVAPADGRIILSAQYKGGKTTIVGNLMRALADGEPFLGTFAVNSAASHIVLIDTELPDNMLRRWLRDQQITNTAAVADVVALRGRAGAFNLLDDRCYTQWATRLADLGCDYLILDPLRPALDAAHLDERNEVGQFLIAFDALLTEARIGDTLLVHHMGHTNERARGDSRLQDWPDAIWRIVREDTDPASPRYFSAYGRDINVPEGGLGYDPATRRLTYAQGTRGDIKTEAAYTELLAFLTERDEPLSGRAIAEGLPGDHTRKAIRDALAKAVKDGAVAIEQGPRRAKLHRLVRPGETLM
jgi:hypothetical protein